MLLHAHARGCTPTATHTKHTWACMYKRKKEVKDVRSQKTTTSKSQTKSSPVRIFRILSTSWITPGPKVTAAFPEASACGVWSMVRHLRPHLWQRNCCLHLYQQRFPGRLPQGQLQRGHLTHCLPREWGGGWGEGATNRVSLENEEIPF